MWAASYAVLVPASLYKPVWEYDAEALWKDLSAHLNLRHRDGHGIPRARGSLRSRSLPPRGP